MNIELLTKQDLIAFKQELMAELRDLLMPVSEQTTKEWLRATEVRKMLHISPSTLQNLRINGKLPSSKVGNIHFYRREDLENMLQKNNH